MAFCLPKFETDKFIKALKDGVIDPVKLIAMSSEERRAFFSKVLGPESAHEVNTLLESKLILKNQKQGMVNWAKKLAGISEKTKTDIISKIEKMNTILDATNEKTFLEDLVAKKLGTEVSFEEAKTIATLSNEVTVSKNKIDPQEPRASANRIKYGASQVALMEYVNGLKLVNEKFTIKGAVADFKTNPFQTFKGLVEDIAGIAKGAKASFDNSAIFRQGWKTLFTNPKIWAENALKSFSDIRKQLGLKATDNAVKNANLAEIYGRQNAIDGVYRSMKIDIGNLEEAFPTGPLSYIPVLGRAFKASEVAYTNFLYRMRADLADKFYEIAKQGDVNLKDPVQMQSIGKLINSLTGRGDLGSLEKIGKEVNMVFFSPKMLKSSIDFLTAHQFQKDVTPFVRKHAALNLLKATSGMALILGVAYALNPKSVEMDPRSADFGKIRIGDTRFDVSGGMASVVVLAMREITQASKSSLTGKVTSLNSGKFGATTGMDVFYNFMENKFSPAASIVKDLATGQTFTGTKPTVGGEAVNLFVPLPITNVVELYNNPNSANIIIAAMADALGIVTNTYSPKKK